MLREPPGREAGEYEWSIFEQAGVLTSNQAVRLLGRRQVDGHVRQGRGRPPRTAMPRSVIDAAAWASTDDQARVVIMTACQQRLATARELDEALSHFPRLRRHALIARTINDISGGITALSEASLVALCRRYGLPEPEMQHLRKAADGRNRYLDAYWPAYRLHVEVDGGHHMSAGHWSADMLRQNQIWIEGDRILRFPARLLRTSPETVAGRLLAALTAHQPLL